MAAILSSLEAFHRSRERHAAAGDPEELREIEIAVLAVKGYPLAEIAPAARLRIGRHVESASTEVPFHRGELTPEL